MAGMKIRCTIIRNLTSSEAKGAMCGILLLLLAFAVPRSDFAEEKPVTAKVSQQQSNPVAPQKSVAAATSPRGGRRQCLCDSRNGSITDVRIAPEEGQLTVAVTTDRAIVPKEIILDNPPRLVLDFPNTENKVRFSKLPVLSASRETGPGSAIPERSRPDRPHRMRSGEELREPRNQSGQVTGPPRVSR